MTFVKQYLGFQNDIKQIHLEYCHVGDDLDNNKRRHIIKSRFVGIINHANGMSYNVLLHYTIFL